jgi:hypothetical protein
LSSTVAQQGTQTIWRRHSQPPSFVADFVKSPSTNSTGSRKSTWDRPDAETRSL